MYCRVLSDGIRRTQSASKGVSNSLDFPTSPDNQLRDVVFKYCQQILTRISSFSNLKMCHNSGFFSTTHEKSLVLFIEFVKNCMKNIHKINNM